jgi:hypothetical protein
MKEVDIKKGSDVTESGVIGAGGGISLISTQRSVTTP